MDQISIAKSNYATFQLSLQRFLYFSTVHSDIGLYIVLSVEKKTLKVVNNIPIIGLWRSLASQNSHAAICPLILMTNLIGILHCLLKMFHSFPEYFKRPHIYFIRYCNSPTEITRNHFLCDIFENSQILVIGIFETPQRRHGKGIFSRYTQDVLKTSHKRHFFWDVFETP